MHGRPGDGGGGDGGLPAVEAIAMIALRPENPVSLRISITDRCQFRCLYCMPAEGIPSCGHQDILTYEEIVRFVRCVHGEVGVSKVRITGGDPLARRDPARLVRMLAEAGVPDIAMTTNGQLLAEHAEALREAGLMRVNISLDSLDPETFRRLSRGGVLENSLRGIDAALRQGLRPVKLNMVVLKGVNDAEVWDMASFAVRQGCEVRFLEVMPLGVAAEKCDEWFVSSEDVRLRVSRAFEMTALPFAAGETARNYAIRDSEGRETRAGLISPCSAPFCGGCRRLRLTADGHLLGCLRRDARHNIRPHLATGDAGAAEGLKRFVEQVLGEKKLEHRVSPSFAMAAIGG